MPGQGFGLYTIYVKADNGPYEPWLENTTEASGTFTGLNNVTYQFYAIARDLVGNEELPKTAAEATTMVFDQSANLAYERWLEEYFTPTEIAAGLLTARDADPDADGRSNQYEFAFVTDPRTRDSSSLIAFRTSEIFVIHDWRRTLGVNYRIERSNNLIHWQTETNVTETVLQTSGELQYVEVAVPLEGNQVRFVRVRAQ